MERDIQGPDDILRAQIDEARVLISAGNWQEARQRLTALAREYPAQAAVYAALGDCYSSAGRWRDAVTYYRQALDREYDPEVAANLAQARDHLSAVAESSAVTKRTVVAVAASFVILLAVIVTVVLVARHSQQSRPPVHPTVRVAPAEPVLRPTPGAGRPAVVNPPPALPAVPVTPQAPTGAPSGVEQPPPAPPPSRQPLPPVIVTKRVEAPSTDQDFYLTQLLGALAWPDGTPVSGDALVQTDPYNGFAFVTLSIPRALQGDLTESVLRQAYNSAVTLFKSDPGLQSVEVRVLEAVSAGAERPRTLVAYRGIATRVAVNYWVRAGQQPNSQEIWHQVFTESWWNPQAPSTASRDNR